MSVCVRVRVLVCAFLKVNDEITKKVILPLLSRKNTCSCAVIIKRCCCCFFGFLLLCRLEILIYLFVVFQFVKRAHTCFHLSI